MFGLRNQNDHVGSDFHRYIRDSQGEHADHVRKSLNKMHTSLSIYSETTENTLAATSRIEGGVTEIKEGLETVHQSIEGLTSTICTTIQSELDRQMNNFLLSFLSPSELKALLPHQQAQTGCISRGLQLRLSDSGQELNNGKTIVLQGQKHITSSTDYQNSSQEWTSSSSEGVAGTELSPRRKPQTIYSPTTRKTETSSYRIPTVAGILQTTTTVTQITCTISSRRNAEEKSFTECRRTLTFFPFSCFRLKAFRASYESVPNLNDCNVSRSLNFRYFHTVPFDSLGFRRAIKGDWKGLRQLIEAGEITPLDVDPNGRGLLDYSSDFDSNITDENLEMIQYLIDLGADPSGLMPKVLQQCQSNSSDYMCGKSEMELQAFNKIDALGKLFLHGAQRDPFQDPRNLLELWKTSGSGSCILPLGINYFLHEFWSGLDELAYEYPDLIFKEIVCVMNKCWANSDEEDFQRRHNFRFEALKSLCSRGVKSRVFAIKDRRTLSLNQDTCFCQDAPSHLLFLSLWDVRYWTYDVLWRNLIDNHLRRTLVLLLQNGEDAHMRCSCNLPWNQIGRGSRSPTCLAAEAGLLHIWVDALREAGIDSTGIVDDWLLMGFSDLFRLPGDEDYRTTRRDFGCNCCDCLNASQNFAGAPDIVAPPDVKSSSALNMIKPLAHSVGSVLSYII